MTKWLRAQEVRGREETTVILLNGHVKLPFQQLHLHCSHAWSEKHLFGCLATQTLNWSMCGDNGMLSPKWISLGSPPPVGSGNVGEDQEGCKSSLRARGWGGGL